MDQATRNRFKTLLVGLPFWTRARDRRAFVEDALWGHPIAREFVEDGSGPTVAAELLRLCADYDTPTEAGTTSLCALLAEVRNRGLATGERRTPFADLEGQLRCASPKPAWDHDPYPGLLALDHWQAPIFFGRTVETRDLLRRLGSDQGRRFVVVTGASGSGKSSVVRAGLWATLAAGSAPSIPGSDQWLITDMFPAAQGGDPFLALTNSLRQHPRLGWLYPGEEADTLKTDGGQFQDLLGRVLNGGPPEADWLLILDQMEELFTPAAAAYRDSFLDLLLAAVELPRFRVVATVRSDFWDQCVAHDGLREVLNSGGQYSIGHPGPLAMGRMVAGPVEEVALASPMTIDPELVSRIVDDAVAEPGGLALMAFALKDLYDSCKDKGRLDLSDYEREAFGGLKGVIARRADRALGRAGKEGEAAVPRVFSRLLTVQADGKATRRRERKDHWAGDAAAETLIDELTRKDTRLLVVGPDAQPTVEVAHEALLREWPFLAGWIEKRVDALRHREQLETEAHAWAARGHPDHLRWVQIH